MMDDPEEPDDFDIDHDGDEDSATTEPCPSCGGSVYEDAEICPKCGQYISQQDSTSRKPLWIIVTTGVCVAVILVVWVLLRL
jgi:predicted nucleic acid-binding Zn ribbon protein